MRAMMSTTDSSDKEETWKLPHEQSVSLALGVLIQLSFVEGRSQRSLRHAFFQSATKCDVFIRKKSYDKVVLS